MDRRDGRLWAALAIVAYPLLVHFGVAGGRPALAFVALVLLAIAASALSFRRRAVAVAVAVALAVPAWMISFSGGGRALLFVPPVLVNVALALFFGRTLRPGSEPLVTRFSRRIRGVELPPALVRYTRRVTIVWTALFIVLAIESAALAAFAPVHVWSLFTNFLNSVFVGALFVAEYAYHSWRYPNPRVPSFFDFARQIARVASSDRV